MKLSFAIFELCVLVLAITVYVLRRARQDAVPPPAPDESVYPCGRCPRCFTHEALLVYHRDLDHPHWKVEMMLARDEGNRPDEALFRRVVP